MASVQTRKYRYAGVPADLLSRLFRASDRLYAQTPWRRFAQPVLVQVELPEAGLPCGCVTFRRRSNVLVLYESAEDCDRGTRHQLSSPPGDMLIRIVSFPRAVQLGQWARTEAAKHGSSIIPAVTAIEDGADRELDNDDVRAVVGAMEPIARFMVEHPHAGSLPDLFRTPTRGRYPIEWLPGRPHAVVTVPHPDAARLVCAALLRGLSTGS